VERAERYWRAALARSRKALDCGALVPLTTEVLADPDLEPFVLRRLLSETPKHLRPGGPRANPFLPWEQQLQVELLGSTHVLLLNKFPVQPGHLLVITRDWQPQASWLETGDWQVVAQVEQDTGGLWFFNSCAAAGASQPHRHLQLLPRHSSEISCPLNGMLQAQLGGGDAPWPWRYKLSRRHKGGPEHCSEERAAELARIYLDHARDLGLGTPLQDPQPCHPYNLLFSDDWVMTVRRQQEHCAGFSLNALGFAGYLLATELSDLNWLRSNGPWRLLQQVAAIQ
jgi:sulfate adenylyltransferase (ADP) / ATP adenylyltransferase